MTYDHINPNHYKGGRKFEPIDVIEDWGLNYHLGNALKYISRNGRKPGEDPREGLSKAIWYLERLQDQLDCCDCNPCEELCLCDPCDECPSPADDQDQIEFEALGSIPNSVLFGSDDDLLASTVPFTASYDDVVEFDRWGKDLSKFEDDEIVFQSYEGGYVFGHLKNGDVRILGKRGEAVMKFDGDNAPSEYEPILHDC